MKTRHLSGLVGLGLSLALGLPAAVAQDKPADNARQVRTDPIHCEGKDKLKLKDVEVRVDTPITASGDCELEFKNVVIRGDNASLVISDTAELELKDSQVYASVTIKDRGELELKDSTVHSDVSLEDGAKAEFKRATVTGKLAVGSGVKVKDKGGNNLPKQ